MGETFIAVRDVDEETYRKFKASSVKNRLKLGKALTKAMEYYLEEQENKKIKPHPKNLLKISGIIKTKEKVRWSEEIDEILYGGKDDTS